MNRDSKRFFIVLLVISTFLGSLGQLFFKMGLSDHSETYEIALIAVGIVAYGSATLAYFYALGRSNLSWAYGFGGLSYVFTSLLAFVVLGEPVTALRVAGIAIIAVGTALIGAS
ncbi:MAG: EamA family transporter [Candidatus Micrarchaeota archaeon]|nr:EamA family transporter [Candidatus Micrarchaeota archaeon]